MTVAVGLALAGPAAPSQAAPACTGVTVVVEFNSLGGGDQTRCVPDDPDSGVSALRGAGFTPTRAAQEAGYFLCRIDGKPADDPCQRASPEDAYWSYWHAEPGGSWTFSNAGAASYDPAPGSVEGWSFGGGEPPSTPPPSRERAPESPRPAATTAASRTPPPAAPTTRQTTAAPTVATTTTRTASASTVATLTTRAPSAAAASSASSASRSAGSPSTDPVPVAGDLPRPSDGDGGSPLVGVLLAVAVVGGLGAAAAFQAQKRR